MRDEGSDTSADNTSEQPDTPTLHEAMRDSVASEAPGKETLGTKLSSWLDSRGGPSLDEVEKDIAETPAKMRRWWLRRKARKELAKRQQEERARLEAEIAETRELLAQQEAERQAEAAERARLARLEVLHEQQARETDALLNAARDLDGTDEIPDPDNRPMLQQPGEELTDEELVARAREKLPEWRRRDRIASKAAAIQAQLAAQLDSDQQGAASASTSGTSAEDGADPGGYAMPYLPPETTDPDPAWWDTFRRVMVTVAWGLMVLASLTGLGVLGDAQRLPEVSNGAYHSAATLLSMVVWHQAIWPVLWVVGLIYVLHQWHPSQRSALRQRRTGWLMANAMLAWAVWFPVLHLQPWTLEVIVWLISAVLTVKAATHLNQHTARNRIERFCTDTTIGLFTGWALAFSATSALTGLHTLNLQNLLWLPEDVWACLILLGALFVAATLCNTERGRLSIALAMTWGMVSVTVVRMFGDNPSTWVTAVAGLGIFLVLLTTENRRYRIRRAQFSATG